MAEEKPVHELRPKKPTWTHLALHVEDVHKMIEWYKEFTHLDLLFLEEDEDGFGAWMGDKTEVENPFILVMASFFEGKDPFAPMEHPPLGPFAHIGIEMPDKESIDEIAAKGKEAGCLILGPQQMPKRIGYICFLRDPEGNVVEYSYDQGVYEKAKEVWGKAA